MAEVRNERTNGHWVLPYLHLMATTNDPAQMIVHFSVFPVRETSKLRYS